MGSVSANEATVKEKNRLSVTRSPRKWAFRFHKVADFLIILTAFKQPDINIDC